MLICYINEVSKMDIEITSVLRKKPIVNPKPEPKDFRKLKLGKINNENWNSVYQQREAKMFKKNMFFLLDKHLYSTSALNIILGLVEATKFNNKDDRKCFTDMIRWYLTIRNTLLNLMSRVFKVEKMQH